MQVKYSFVCDAANISSNGNLNALGIFNQINASKFPCTHPRFIYAVCISFHISEVGKHNFRLFFINDDGKEILPQLNGIINVTSSSLNSNNILLELNGVQFPKAGTYQIDLTIDNQHACSEYIQVNSTTQLLQ